MMNIVNKRHKHILDLLEEQSQISTNDLVTALDISRETVRRDLNTLAKRGLLVKIHGGAISKNSASNIHDLPILMREATNTKEKQDICAYAASFIKDNDSIFIDNSSTAIQLINYIPKTYNLTLITNSIKLLVDLAKISPVNWNVISLGGNFNLNYLSTSNYLAVRNLQLFKPNKAFLSCHSIGDDCIVSDSSIHDVEIKYSVLNSCQTSFLLVDYTKFGNSGFVTIGDASKFDHIITNSSASPAFIKLLRTSGCNVHLVGNR